MQKDLESLELFNPLFLRGVADYFCIFICTVISKKRQETLLFQIWNSWIFTLRKCLKYLNFRAKYFLLACMRGNTMHSKVYACMSRSGRSKGIFSTWSWRIGNLCTFTSGDIRHVINSNQTLLSFSALLLLKILSSK